MFDLVVGASSIYGGSWLEGAGRCTPRTRRCAGSPTSSGLPAEARGVFVPGGTIGNLSALVAARHTARSTRRRRVSGPPVARGGHPRRALLDPVGVRRHGRRVRRGRGGRVRPPHRAAAARGPARARPRDLLRRRRHRAGRPTSASSTTSSRSPRCAGSSGSGSTSTVRMAAPALAAPRCATSTPASSTRTRSSSTRTSGCSLRSTAAPCSTATRPWRGPRTPSTRLPRCPHRRPRVEPDGLLRRPHPSCAWPAVLVPPATHGTRAYTDAVERTLTVTRFAAEEIGRRDYVEVVREPDLSVVVFRRIGWTPARVPGVVRPAAGRRVRLRRAHVARRRDADAVRHRQPEDHRGGHHRHPRHHGLRPATPGGDSASRPRRGRDRAGIVTLGPVPPGPHRFGWSRRGRWWPWS